MSTGTLTPTPRQTFFTTAGVPLVGGLVYTYLAGTSTPATTYSDSALASPNSNPIVLDAAGRCVIYLDPAVGSYKLVANDSLGVLQYTQDNIQAVGAGSSGLGEIFVFGSNSASPVTVTSYASGATFDKLQPGSSVWSVDSATLSGTYVLEAVGVQDTSGTLTVALVNLTSGAPDTPIATCAITSTTGESIQSAAITFPGGGATITYGIKAKVSANLGYVIGARILKTA